MNYCPIATKFTMLVVNRWSSGKYQMSGKFHKWKINFSPENVWFFKRSFLNFYWWQPNVYSIKWWVFATDRECLLLRNVWIFWTNSISYESFKYSIRNVNTEQYYSLTIGQVINLIIMQFCAHPAISHPSALHILLSCIFCLYFIVQVTQNSRCALCYKLIHNFLTDTINFQLYFPCSRLLIPLYP